MGSKEPILQKTIELNICPLKFIQNKIIKGEISEDSQKSTEV